MYEKIWSLEEDNYLISNYDKLTYKEMSKELNCSIETVKKRLVFLGFDIVNIKVRRWTNEEIELLKEMSNKYLNKTIAKKLNRSVSSVNKKARELGIELIFKRDSWKKWQIDYLKDNLNNQNLAKIGEMIDKNYYQIMEKIDELNLDYHSNRWTSEEERILIELAPKCHIREIAKVLDRSEEAVVSKASRLGIEYITSERKFTSEEIEYIKENYGKVSIMEMARKLKVSRFMVNNLIKTIGLEEVNNNSKKWTEEEIEKLRELSKKKTVTKLAKYFNTTNIAISSVASKNNIKLIDSKIKWSDKENKLLREYASDMSIEEIAVKMKKSVGAVRNQMKRLGIAVEKGKRNLWTEEDTCKLRQLAMSEKNVKEIAKILNVQESTVSSKANELGIEIKKIEQRSWTEEEINTLKELSSTVIIDEIADILGRSVASVKRKAKVLEIDVISKKRSWSEDEERRLGELIRSRKTPKEIAEILNRTEESIIVKANRLGFKIQTNNKRYWTREEEDMLSDLWGSMQIETLAKKLNRTVSSLKNKAFQLGLGAQSENNYEGLKINLVSDLFQVDREKITVEWVALGLKLKRRNISNVSSYYYVEIEDLFDFLEKNQNIWDSRVLEKNILGIEPEWLIEKRKRDYEIEDNRFGIDNLTKQQLILAKKYYLEQVDFDEVEDVENLIKNK